VDDELEDMWSSVAWVQELVLEMADGTSSLVVSLSSMAELVDDRIDVTAANGVR
jgi:hypothetical protein